MVVVQPQFKQLNLIFAKVVRSKEWKCSFLPSGKIRSILAYARIGGVRVEVIKLFKKGDL